MSHQLHLLRLQAFAKKNWMRCSGRPPVVGCEVAGNHIGLRIAVRDELAQLLAKAAAHILGHIPRSAHFIEVNMPHLPALYSAHSKESAQRLAKAAGPALMHGLTNASAVYSAKCARCRSFRSPPVQPAGRLLATTQTPQALGRRPCSGSTGAFASSTAEFVSAFARNMMHWQSPLVTMRLSCWAHDALASTLAPFKILLSTHTLAQNLKVTNAFARNIMHVSGTLREL